MKMVYAALATSLVATTAGAQDFKADMSIEDVRAAAGILTLADLAVGEVGIGEPYLCIEDGRLLIPASTRLSTSRPVYGAAYRMRREPGGGLRVDVFFGEKASDKSISKAVTEALLTGIEHQVCPSAKMTGEKMETVSSLNGASTLKDLLGD